MFGYVVINKGEMKFKDFDLYQSYYCGLCKTLREICGTRGQLSLPYDMTFLAVLLSALYEPTSQLGACRCIVHPVHRHSFRQNDCIRYVADMNLLLTYYKCKDDWLDERKYSHRLYMGSIQRIICDIEKKYPKKCNLINTQLLSISQLEMAHEQNIDKMADLFGTVMAEIFTFRDDEWAESEESMHLRAAANYINVGHYKEALHVLESISSRTALWYYYSALANSGLGYNVTAMEHAKEAVRLDPSNYQYQMLLQRLERGDSWYETRRSTYGGNPSYYI